jgi:hypothetical protein
MSTLVHSLVHDRPRLNPNIGGDFPLDDAVIECKIALVPLHYFISKPLQVFQKAQTSFRQTVMDLLPGR